MRNGFVTSMFKFKQLSLFYPALAAVIVIGLALLQSGSTAHAQEEPELDVVVTYPEDETNKDEDPNLVEEFSFTERSGRTVTREDLKGKPWLACFIFTRCAATCARVSEAMSKLSNDLEDVDVQLVSITVDPDYDTPEKLTQYAEHFRADPERWWFLTGDKRATFHLLHNSFNVPVQDNPDAPDGFQVIHSNNIMHIDADGRVVGKYNALVDEDVATIRRVLKSGKETPEKYQFVKTKPGIRIGEERVAAELATTAPPEADSDQDRETGEDRPIQIEDLPEWVRRLPAINASLNGMATVLLILGLLLIRSGKVTAHRNVMLTAFGVSVAFLACYLVYHSFHFTKSFEGVGVSRGVYYSILLTHVVLAIPVPFLAAVTIYRGLTGQVEKHRSLAKITFPIWLYVSITGVVIYVMLYHWPS